MKTTTDINKARIETFGGILSIEEPAMLVHVDRQFMRKLGYKNCALWEKSSSNLLSAPCEVHFSVTNRCSSRCNGCYMNSDEPDPDELSYSDFCHIVDLFAEMGVFHMALGGGEAFERPDFLEIANYVRSRGIIPNLTTNGFMVNQTIAEQCNVFGQVNVSIDGIADNYRKIRGVDGYDKACNALQMLTNANVQTGINCTVSRDNFEHLEEVIALAKEYRLNDVELLRFKPFGRGTHNYDARRLTDNQYGNVFRRFSMLAEKFEIPIKIDCSFLPMICFHHPDQKLLDQLSVSGCDAGNTLLGVRSNGTFAGCSFCTNNENAFDIPTLWETSEHLNQCRTRIERLSAPCQECDYIMICKGGCRAVSAFVNGDSETPDPECPFVIAYTKYRR